MANWTETPLFFLFVAEHDTKWHLSGLCCLPGCAPSQTLVHPPAYLWGAGEDVVWETERSWMLCKCCSGVSKTLLFRSTDLVTILKQHHSAALKKITLSQPGPEQLQRKVANAPIIWAERDFRNNLSTASRWDGFLSFISAVLLYGFNQLCSVFFFWFDRTTHSGCFGQQTDGESTSSGHLRQHLTTAFVFLTITSKIFCEPTQEASW